LVSAKAAASPRETARAVSSRVIGSFVPSRIAPRPVNHSMKHYITHNNVILVPDVLRFR
jgi:hypothetical protein